jgi:DNA polymerase-3 subunit gamma/tau
LQGFAKSLNCKNRQPSGEPCNVCDSCNEINNDNRNHPDVFEIDGASNRNIEDVRELKEKVKYGPVRSRYKIFIIDEVHMLTGHHLMRFLKTLEEPPPYVVFIFATTSPEKVPLTILGRCQKFDFKRFTIDEIISRLKFIAGKENIKLMTSHFFIAKKAMAQCAMHRTV